MSASSLLQRARKISLGDWESYRSHFWLSEQDLLFLRHHPGQKNGDYTLCVFDLRTNNIRTLHALTHRFNRKIGIRSEQSLSPDRKWLLWTDSGTNQPMATVASLDAQQEFTWPISNESDPIFWTPDSRAIVSTVISQTYGSSATLRRLRSQPTPEPFRFTPAATICHCDEVYLVASDRAWVLPFETEDTLCREKIVFETSLSRESPRLRRFTVTFPAPVFVWGACFSPDGSHIAWLLANHVRERAGIAGLWVSGSDGRSLRQIGQVPTSPNSDFSDVHWTPGGRHLSFVCDNSLWLMTAQ